MKSFAAVLISALICPTGYAATRTTTLLVPDMTCTACPITVKKVLSRMPGVTEVSVNFEKRQVTVVFDDTKTTVDALTGATADAGYPSTPEAAGAQ
jgi:mercuric ion binding protein